MEPTFFEKIIIKYLFENLQVKERLYPFLTVNIFDDAHHIKIIKYFLKFREEYNKFPTINEMKVLIDEVDVYNSLKEIMNIDTSEYGEDFILSQIEDFFKKKLILNTITDTATNLSDDKLEKISDAPDQLREALAFSFNTEVGFDLFNNADAMYDFLHNKDKTVSTGVESFDKIIDGGFHEKSLSLFMAETNMGKSLIMCALAVNAILQNKSVLYITLEMSEKKISERLLANIFDITMGDLSLISKNQFIEKFNVVRQKFEQKVIVKEYATKTINTNHLRTLVKELSIKKKFVPDIIFVDYIGIMLSNHSRKEENSNSEVMRISQELRGFAVDVISPVVSAIQTNRGGFGNSEIDLTDVADSIGSTTIADLIVGVTQSDELRVLGKYSWQILKNRYGLNKVKCTVKVDYYKMRISDDTDNKTENLAGVSSPPSQKENESRVNAVANKVNILLNNNDQTKRNKVIDFT